MAQLRQPIPFPESLDSKHRPQWDSLNKDFGPIVFSDSLGDQRENVQPFVMQCGWWSLYATALLWMEAEGQQADLSQPDQPFVDGWDRAVTHSYWQIRQTRLNTFRSFLNRWHIASRFGFSSKDLGVDGADDECVLWFHKFSSLSDVQRYAVRWALNPNLKSGVLRAHRLVISRGIDLICSELLANAVEHSGGADGFILAKLCSPQSAAVSLQLDQGLSFLTPTERVVYADSAQQNHPVLQLVVGDCGQGFGGNEPLREMYRKALKRPASSVADLIEFALRPEVSTKGPYQRMAALKEIDEDSPEQYDPIIHGLSEVLVYVEENRGHWRIHSNDESVEISGSSTERPRTEARKIKGCVHYIQLPLPVLSQQRERPRHPPSQTVPSNSLEILDLGNELSRHLLSPTKLGALEAVVEFTNRLLKHKEDGRTLVVNLLSLDEVDEPGVHDVYTSACFLIADTLQRVRRGAAVLLMATERTRSQLRRFATIKQFLFDRRVLVYIDLFGGPHSIMIDCAADLEAVRELLTQALNPWVEGAVLESENQTVWRVLEEVQVHNSGLLKITPVGEADHALDGRVKIDPDSDLGKALLLGTRNFDAFGAFLEASRALLPLREDAPYWYRGAWRKTHTNLGRVLTNDRTLADIVRWFIAAQAALTASARSESRVPVVFVAVLHPAIGITQEVLRQLSLREELIELSTVGELTPESWQFVAMTGRQIIVVVDLVNSGETLNSLVSLIKYAGGDVIGALSVVTIIGARSEVPLFSYSQCTADQLKTRALEAGKRRAEPTERRVIDCNSQFTTRLAGSITTLSQRARSLVNGRALGLSHRVFGRYHHTVPLFIRKLSDAAVSEIRLDLRNRLRRFGDANFVVLYPGESTIAYLVRRLDDVLPSRNCHAVVPAFRGFGRKRLVFDGRHEGEEYDAKTPVLFIDDSLSSGETEGLARAAWDEELRSKSKRGADPIEWTSYVVLRRGRYEQQGTGSEYCAIGPRAYTVGDCPFCDAITKLKRAYQLLEPMRSEAGELLASVVAMCEPLPLESNSETFLLGPTDTIDFIELSSSQLWESAYQLATTREAVSSGMALFTALHAAELSAYLMPDQIVDLIHRFSNSVGEGTQDKARQLITCLALLPTAYSQPALRVVARSLIGRGISTPTSAVAAVVVGAVDESLRKFEAAGMHESARMERYGQFLGDLRHTVVEPGRNASGEVQACSRAVQLDIRSLSSPSGTSNLVQLARTLSAIFYEGFHDTLLMPQLDSVTNDSLDRISEQLLNAVTRLNEFAELTNNFTGDELVEARDGIERARTIRDCGLFRDFGAKVVGYWQRLKNTYFHTPTQLHTIAVAGLDRALLGFAEIPEASTWFAVNAVPKHIAEWRVLGPEPIHLRGHFENLFTNTVKHAKAPFHQESLRNLTRGHGEQGLLGQLRWERGPGDQVLRIHYSQSFPVGWGNPAMGGGLMAETTALLNMFGGSLIPLVGNFKQSGSDDDPPILQGNKDVCLTNMPVVWEKAR